MKSQSLRKERRRHRRFELINLVVYKQFEIEEVTETINLSMGGMKMRTEFPVPLDEELDISIRFGFHQYPGGKPQPPEPIPLKAGLTSRGLFHTRNCPNFGSPVDASCIQLRSPSH
jgi:hypothetical protein